MKIRRRDYAFQVPPPRLRFSVFHIFLLATADVTPTYILRNAHVGPRSSEAKYSKSNFPIYMIHLRFCTKEIPPLRSRPTLFGGAIICIERGPGRERREEDTVTHRSSAFQGTTVEPRSKAPAYKAMFAYKAFEENSFITFCSTLYIGSKV